MDFSKENEALKFYGMYRGIVKDTDDPLKTGRVRISVLQLLEDVKVEFLPWAAPAHPLFTGSGIDTGSFMVPDLEDLVWVFFEEGDINQPVYFAAAVDGVHGLPAERLTNYPTRRVTKTKAGIVIYVDDTDKVIRVTHPTGTFVEIDGAGVIRLAGGAVEVTGTSVNVEAGSIDLTAGTIKLTGLVDIN